MTEIHRLKTIGPHIKAARPAARWTQVRLSDALGFNNRQILSDIENSNRMITPQAFVSISDLLHRDIEYFLDPFSVVGEAKYNWRVAPEVSAANLVNAIRTKLDIEVLYVDTIVNQPRFGISGATCHLPDMTVILINRQEPVCQQHFDLVHGLFHALTWDTMEPAHRESNCIGPCKGSKRIEQLADNSAAGC